MNDVVWVVSVEDELGVWIPVKVFSKQNDAIKYRDTHGIWTAFITRLEIT